MLLYITTNALTDFKVLLCCDSLNLHVTENQAPWKEPSIKLLNTQSCQRAEPEGGVF